MPADFDSLTRLQRRVTGQYNEIITLVGAGTETKDYFTRGSFVLNRISSHPALGGDGIQTIDSPGADLGSANAYVPSFPQGNIGGKLFHSLVSAVENGASLKGNEYTKGDDNAKGGGVIAWNKYSSVDSAVFSHDLSSGDLTVLKAGDYLVSVIIPLESTNITAAQRNTHRAELLINGNAIPTAVGESSYIRLIEGHNESSNHFAVLVPLAANDKLTVKTTPTAKIGGESSIGTCSLYAELVEGDRNVFSASATEIQSGENLIAHWDFESGTKDSVYGLEGELLNGAVLAEMDDMNVLDLSGGGRATMKVATGDLLDLAATRDQVTVSFWQKFKSIGNTASFNGQSGSMSHSKGFGAHAPYGSGTMVWDTAGCCNGSTQRIYKANPGFDYKQWHHLAFVKDKGKKSIWIDGQLFHQGNNSAALPMDMSALWVGSTTNGNISINGAIDDFKVYAQALTGGQIAGQYSQGRDNVKGSVKLHDPGTNLNVKHDWKLIFRQTTPYYHSNDNNWATAKELNPGDPTNDNFSILNQLESFRGSDGKLHLKLIYPNLNPNSYQEWKQTSNPVTRTSGGVDGYEPIDEDWSFNDWGGLEYNGGPSLLDGSANHHYYYYGIGSKPFGTGFPGPSHAVNKVELYVMETPGTGDQNLVWTSTRQGSGYTHSDRDAGITLKDDGNYMVYVNVPLKSHFASPYKRGSVGLTITLDDVIVQGARGQQGYIRNADDHLTSSIHFSGVINAQAGQVLQVFTQQLAEAGKITVQANRTASIFIEKLGNHGLYSDSFTGTTAGRDLNPVNKTALAFVGGGTSLNIIDNTTYSNEGSNQESIVIKKTGSYLLSFNGTFEIIYNNTRTNPRVTVEVNGTEVPGVTSRAHYIRNDSGHNESSGSFVALLDLFVDDVVTVSVQKAGQMGLVTSPEGGKISLQYKNPAAATSTATMFLSGLNLLTKHSRFPADPNELINLTDYEFSKGDNSGYGTLIQGYFHPEQTGWYRFAISAEDEGQLFLSTDSSPGNKKLIASATDSQGERDYANEASQSGPIHLQRDRVYYIETHQWRDSVSVSFQYGQTVTLIPAFTNGDQPIDGSYLSPYVAPPVKPDTGN